MKKEILEIETKILEVLETIKPYLVSDGGDIELVKYEDNIAYVKLVGVCGHCPHRSITVNNLVKQTLMDEISEIEDVINVPL